MLITLLIAPQISMYKIWHKTVNIVMHGIWAQAMKAEVKFNSPNIVYPAILVYISLSVLSVRLTAIFQVE